MATVLLLPHFLLAQVGGRQTFEFMRIPSHARLAGVGGVNVSLHQGDVNMFMQNPALLDDESSNKAALSYSRWHADINNTDATYTHNFKNLGQFGFGLRVINYGRFDQTTPSGQVVGTFNANDFAFIIAHARQQENFTFGASLKFLGSQIENFQAYALAFDLGAVFKHPEKDFTFGLAIKNLGVSLSKFTPDARTNLPFDVQIGTSFKPEYMPFRFSISLHHLYQFDIVFLDPNLSTQLDANGNTIVEEKTFFDKLARHFVIGGELLLAEGFHVRLGYNHLINREMQVQNLGNLRGFSFGFMLRVKAFEFAFSRGTYHIGAGRNFLTLSTDFDKIFKRKE